MNWKIFLTLCAGSFLVSFPQNIIGCGAEVDPYDYYSSFFNADMAAASLKPFYYTANRFLYDEQEPVSVEDTLSRQWAAYTGNVASAKDAKAFVTSFAQKDISTLYFNIEKKQPLKIPDSVRRNSMTTFFLTGKDPEALGYIIYAKKVEPFVTGDANSWEPVERDSVTMAKQIKNGEQLLAAAKTNLFKLKYAYQIVRLAHYSGNYKAAIQLYDTYVAPNHAEDILQSLSLSLKAGAMYHLGLKKESAYIFSKLFATSDVKKIAHYLSFKWAADSKADRSEYLAVCKNEKEKADMLALFSLGSAADEITTIEKIYDLNPNNNFIETLVVREINKLEETYFSPAINKMPGGTLFYYNWAAGAGDSVLQQKENIVNRLTAFLLRAGKQKTSSAPLFTIAAGYCALMTKNFSAANTYLENAKKMRLTNKLKDQWMLTNLLLAINEQNNFNAATEEKILPSLKWLRQKALTEKVSFTGWMDFAPWKIFYRNIFTGALSKKYHEKGEIYKEALCIGAAESLFAGDYNSMVFLHDKTDVKDVENMYALMTAKNKTPFENFLLDNNKIKQSDVVDFAGTAYLRNYDYANAVLWLQKTGTTKKYATKKNPFIELFKDVEEIQPGENTAVSKINFARQMLQLEKQAKTDKQNAAKYYYKTALGLYNITYYGHTWELVQYYRSGSDGYMIPANATAFEKQYYGCYAAHDMFKKALDASSDKNFKAKCLFMMAKCSQKNIRRPQYEDFPNNYENFEAAEKVFLPLFKKNKYFPQLIKEYGNTAFFEDISTRCSYLADFVEKNK